MLMALTDHSIRLPQHRYLLLLEVLWGTQAIHRGLVGT